MSYDSGLWQLSPWTWQVNWKLCLYNILCTCFGMEKHKNTIPSTTTNIAPFQPSNLLTFKSLKPKTFMTPLPPPFLWFYIIYNVLKREMQRCDSPSRIDSSPWNVFRRTTGEAVQLQKWDGCYSPPTEQLLPAATSLPWKPYKLLCSQSSRRMHLRTQGHWWLVPLELRHAFPQAAFCLAWAGGYMGGVRGWVIWVGCVGGYMGGVRGCVYGWGAWVGIWAGQNQMQITPHIYPLHGQCALPALWSHQKWQKCIISRHHSKALAAKFSLQNLHLARGPTALDQSPCGGLAKQGVGPCGYSGSLLQKAKKYLLPSVSDGMASESSADPQGILLVLKPVASEASNQSPISLPSSPPIPSNLPSLSPLLPQSPPISHLSVKCRARLPSAVPVAMSIALSDLIIRQTEIPIGSSSAHRSRKAVKYCFVDPPVSAVSDGMTKPRD